MPNHVYTHITVDEKYSKKLEEIAKVGLCRYYAPMPLGLKDTTSPTRVVTQKEYDKQMKENETAKYKSHPITKKMQSELIDKYGIDNWYDWSHKKWGTKWGCYDNEFHDGQYRFTTAWGPVNDSIIEMLLKDIPNLDYSYEEEQGWGSETTYDDGEIESSFEWDVAPFDYDSADDNEIYFLESDYQNGEGSFKMGFYLDANLSEFLGETLEEAQKELNV